MVNAEGFTNALREPYDVRRHHHEWLLVRGDRSNYPDEVFALRTEHSFFEIHLHYADERTKCRSARAAGYHAGLHRVLSRTIRIPVHMNEHLNKCLRTSRKLEKELGRSPTNEEIGLSMHIPVQKVQKLKAIGRAPVSLGTLVGPDGLSSLGQLIEDRGVSPLDAVTMCKIADEVAWIRITSLSFLIVLVLAVFSYDECSQSELDKVLPIQTCPVTPPPRAVTPRSRCCPELSWSRTKIKKVSVGSRR